MRPHWLSQPPLPVKEHQQSKDFLQAINHCSDKNVGCCSGRVPLKQSPWWWPFPPGSPHPHPDSDSKTPFFDNSLLLWIHIKDLWGWRAVEVRGQFVGISLIPLGGFQTDQTRVFWQRPFPAEPSPSPQSPLFPRLSWVICFLLCANPALCAFLIKLLQGFQISGIPKAKTHSETQTDKGLPTLCVFVPFLLFNPWILDWGGGRQ